MKTYEAINKLENRCNNKNCEIYFPHNHIFKETDFTIPEGLDELSYLSYCAPFCLNCHKHPEEINIIQFGPYRDKSGNIIEELIKFKLIYCINHLNKGERKLIRLAFEIINE